MLYILLGELTFCDPFGHIENMLGPFPPLVFTSQGFVECLAIMLSITARFRWLTLSCRLTGCHIRCDCSLPFTLEATSSAVLSASVLWLVLS